MSAIVSAAQAQDSVDGVRVSNVRTERNGEYMVVGMTLDLSGLDVEGNRALVVAQIIIVAPAAVDTHRRESSRFRAVGQTRGEQHGMLSGRNETSYKARKAPASVEYSQIIPYQEWMNGSELSLKRSDYGCCNTLLAQQDGMFGTFVDEVADTPFFPELVYVYPQAENEKIRSLEGSAFIDFPVDKTVIYPDYRRNTVELGKIESTIDSVRNDSDVKITSVLLKGFASPESPYSHNRDLAKGRTAALKSHIQRLYKFDDGVISTDYEPEDWEGLRRYVEQSNLEHRSEILAMIDSDMDPDAKEAKIKRTYPEEYRFLLQHCYPALRHTDYRIAYVVRSYSDPEDIIRIMRTKPQNLSLNEFYLAARTYEPGTDEFADVFETAVRMYPQDETANINAANAAMRRNDLDGAERYLEKAGDSAEAVYARGALAIRRGDYPTARRYMEQARKAGLEQAAATLEELDKKAK